MNNSDVMSFQAEQAALGQTLVEKHGWLLSGVPIQQRQMIAQLLENQTKRPTNFLLEGDQTTSTLPVSTFPSQIAFPAIVQTFPALVANQLVQVQAMNAPRALVLYKQFVRSSGGTLLTHRGSWGITAEQGTPQKARMKLDLLSLTAEKYMLGMQWTTELEEDAAAMGGISIQPELIAMLRDEVGGQIDDAVILDLYTAATAGATTGSNGLTTSRAGAGNVNFSVGTYASWETPKAHEEMLFNALIDLKVAIYNASYRQADFIVGDAAAIGKLEKATSFARNYGPQLYVPGQAANGAANFGTAPNASVSLVGRFANQWDVYLSASAPTNTLLMGVKQAGYVLGIYRPFELTEPFYDNTTDEWIRSVRTRIARQTVDAAFYGTLTFTA